MKIMIPILMGHIYVFSQLQGDQMRPRVVKRGVGDFESIDEGTYEPTHRKL